MPPDPEPIRTAEETLHPEERTVRDQHGHPLPGTNESPDSIAGGDADPGDTDNPSTTNRSTTDRAMRRP